MCVQFLVHSNFHFTHCRQWTARKYRNYFLSVICRLFQGFHEYVSLLLKHGAGVALPDVEGKTPLHWAASSDAAVAAAAATNSNASHASAAK